MKAKKKPLTKLTPKDLGVSTDSKLEITQVSEPPKRVGGKKVDSVDELLSKLKTEAGVI
jgi:electron transfer flavoprotein beta subunit